LKQKGLTIYEVTLCYLFIGLYIMAWYAV